MTDGTFALTYNFSCKELKLLASIMRERQNEIPIELFNFSREVQKKVYECMSIDEVEKLQNESR